MIGMSERFEIRFVRSCSTSREMSTVNSGADDFTVSANETSTYHRAIRPRKSVVYLEVG